MSIRTTKLILLLLALAGAASILVATRYGAGTTPDSIVYIGAARNLLAGNGLIVPFGEGGAAPLTHHAPFYPIVLAGGGLFGMDPLVGARWLSAILMACLIFWVGFWLLEATQGAAGVAILGAVLTLAAIPILEIHAYAWSEALFILLGFGGLWILSRATEKSAFKYWGFAALAAGLAVLTRYAGLAFVATGAVSILSFQREKFPKKLRNALLYSVLSLLPFALWTFRNSMIAGTATSRAFAFHPITWAHLRQALQTASGWLLVPAQAPGLLKAGAIALLCAAVVGMAIYQTRQARVSSSGPIPAFIKIDVVFIGVYCAFLVFSLSFFDANIPLDDRILAPLFVALLLASLYFLHGIFRAAQNRRAVSFGITLAALLFGVGYLYNGITWISEAATAGLGFSSLRWQQSEFVSQIEHLHPEAPLFSNLPHAVYILTGKSAMPLPRKVFVTSQQINENYVSDLSQVGARLRDENGYLVYFKLPLEGAEQAEQELVDFFSLSIVSQAAEGTIYAVVLK